MARVKTPRPLLAVLLAGLLVSLVVATSGCSTCTAMYRSEIMELDAVELPKTPNPLFMHVELCRDGECSTAGIGRARTGGPLTCLSWVSEDGESGPGANCRFSDDDRTFVVAMNTAYLGDTGSERISVTAIDAFNHRTLLLTGRALYKDTSGGSDSCGDRWKGTFYRD